MKSKLILRAAALLLAASLMATFTCAADGASGEFRVYVRGVRIDCTVADDGTVCVPLYDFCTEMTDGEAAVSCDGGVFTAVWNGTTVTAATGEEYIISNDRYFWCGAENVTCGGGLYVSVDALARAFGAEAKHDDVRGRVTVGDGGDVMSGGEYYDKTELFWLSHIIAAESRGEPLYGKIAVGTVVYDRVESEKYPNTVYGVIFDMRHGVQFAPAYTGSVFRTPNEESIIAAKLCMDGARVPGEPFYFCTTEIMSTSWAGKNRPYIETIGNHAFFA